MSHPEPAFLNVVSDLNRLRTTQNRKGTGFLFLPPGFHSKCPSVAVQQLSCVQLFATPLDCSLPDTPALGFSRQEYWNGLPLPPPRDLPNLGIKSASPAWAGGFFIIEPPGKPFLKAPPLKKM